MTSTSNVVLPIIESQSPYWDNGQAEIANNYVALLFQPSRALQSRELITLQTLLQFQCAQLGSFDFQNGSPVSGGAITFDNSVTSIQLQANDSTTLAQFNGQLIINSVGAVNTQAVVVAVDSSLASNTSQGALLIKYLSGNEFPDDAQIVVATDPAVTGQLLSANSNSAASVAYINPGVFFVDGYFLYIGQQAIPVNSLSAFPSAYIGLEIDQSIVTYQTDSSLLDPAQGAFNYQAPGADRLQLQISLATRALTSSDTSAFIPLVTVTNGIVTNQVSGAQLGGINAVLAQNIQNINGSFVVNPFLATTSDDPSNANGFIINISPGLGYVDGFEFQTISTTQLSDAKAQTTATSNAYYMSLDFGNYLNTTNVYTGNAASFNTGEFGSLDLHIVPSGNVNTKNTQAYANTLVGTAWIRDIEYNGANSWLSYLLNVNLAPFNVTPSAVSANTTMVYFPSTFTSSANAIANVPFTVLSGNASGWSGIIVSYDASAKIGYLNAPTNQLLDTTSALSLGFAIKDVNGLVSTPAAFTGNAFYTQNTSAGFYPCMDVNPFGGKDINGNTVLFSTNLNRMDYPLGQTFVAQGDFSSVTFQTRLTLSNVQFTGGNATIGSGSGLDTNQQYTMGFADEYIDNTEADVTFFVAVRNAQTSNLANGQTIVWNYNGTNGNGVYQTDDQHCTLAVDTTGNFIADVLVTVQDNNASVNFRRSKTLVGNTSNTTLAATDSYLNATQVVGSANTYIDTTNGYVWFTGTQPAAWSAPGTSQYLYLADVIQIIKVYASGNLSYAPNATNAIDVTSSFGFLSGQNDNYYDHSSLVLLPGSQPPTGQTVVMLQAYIHDDTDGFFSADSYSAAAYANNLIPIYSSQAFGAVSLRDVIDFRPTRTIGTSANVQVFNLTGLELPQPDSSWVGTYDYYLPRIDSLLLTANRQFAVLQGVPSLAPTPPSTPAGAMLLYTLLVPQYTYLAANVTLTYQENSGYTMKDIGALDQRIQQLEYYVSLSQLEQQATQTTVLYQNGTTAKEPYGIVTDAFVDYSVADTTNPDLSCQISNGVCAAYQTVTPVGFSFTSNTGPLSNNDYTFSLDYTETPVIVQNTASNYEQIQPYAFGQFQGQITLHPASDYWYSDNLVPQIVGPPADVPTLSNKTPTPSASTVGLDTDKNSANLTPATTTTVAGIPVPPALTQGVIAAEKAGEAVYAIPVSGWDAAYGSLFSLADAYLWYPQGVAVVVWNGQPYLLVEKTATGWALMSPVGNWYPATYTNDQTINSLTKKAVTTNSSNSILVTSQSVLNEYL